MIDMCIIVSKYLFILYIALFVFFGFMICLRNQDMTRFSIKAGLSNQRICIILFHITASVILISASLEYDMRSAVIYCVSGFFLIMGGNMAISRLYKNGSQLLYNCVFFLMDIGLMMLYRLNTDLALRQLAWNAIGIAMMLVMPRLLVVMPRLDRFKIVYVIISFALLGATLIFGSSEFGAKNWLSIGPVGFQPSEIIKVCFIFYLASAFAEKPKIKDMIVPAIISAVIVLVLVAGQKDLGSALIFYMTFLAVLFMATSNYLYFFGGIAFLGLAASIAYRLFDHIRVRFEAWQNPWLDVSDTGYQIAQSLFAICTWGVTGIGFTRGYASSIPVVERDFIFAAVCEEFGVIFAVGLICVFMLIFLEGARGAARNNNRFLALVCAGLTALIAFQSFLIIGGVIKLIPLTGVTLPFVSYGGTSVVISYITIAIIQWIIMRNEQAEQALASEKKENERPARAQKKTSASPARQPKARTAERTPAKTLNTAPTARKTARKTPAKTTNALERPSRRSSAKTPPPLGRPESYNRKRRDK